MARSDHAPEQRPAETAWRRLKARVHLPDGATAWRIASVTLGVLALAAILVGLTWYGAGRDHRGSSAQFDATARPGVARVADAADRSAWPVWGLDLAHTRFVEESVLAPPFKQAWRFDAGGELAFPPAVGPEELYLASTDHGIYFIDRATGKRRLTVKPPGPLASQPTIWGDLLLQSSKDGSVYAIDRDDGSIAWQVPTDGPVESAPVVADGRIVFGSHDGLLYGYAANPPRRVLWTVEGEDAFKGTAAIHEGTVYAGNYDGRLYAVDLGSGELKWSTQTRRSFSLGGALYSTPAVAYGRVYVGSTDGRVYALGTEDGEVLWATSTDDWVYASPAVAHERVFVGSYDGTFYALDARTGEVAWTFVADDRIAGSATVIGDIVYFSSLGGTTYGLEVGSGRLAWTFPDGRHTPVVADGSRLFVTGADTQYALVPQGAARDGVRTRRTSSGSGSGSG